MTIPRRLLRNEAALRETTFDERAYLENWSVENETERSRSRPYLETEFIEHNALSDITVNNDNVMESDVNGKQSLRLPGTTREWQGEHGVAADEHGSALHPNIHNKVFR